MTARREFADGELVPGTRYRVMGLIGSGGMGSVYEVEHEELGKRFVLKALLRDLAGREDLAQRLTTERRALGRLEHPHIVSVTDGGLTRSRVPYYVMERLQGETLGQRLKRERRVSVGEACRIAVQILEGLGAAHGIGVVHRDVKPGNIFLVSAGAKPATVKLLDFGIAKMLDPKASQITGRGIAIGTPRYMAPEQASGDAVDARTDLYSVGLIVYEMIAGTGPFDEIRDANELLLAHLTAPPPNLRQAAPDVPPGLDELVSRLLAKKPADRPRDAAKVAARLARWLPVAARVTDAPPVAHEEDDTRPGGPFDTLEAADTAFRGETAERTSTLVLTSPDDDADRRADTTSTDADEVGQDVVDPGAGDADPAEVETRTAAEVASPGAVLVPAPQGTLTPPPVAAARRVTDRSPASSTLAAAAVASVLSLAAGSWIGWQYLGATPEESVPAPAAAARAPGTVRRPATPAVTAPQAADRPPRGSRAGDATADPPVAPAEPSVAAPPAVPVAEARPPGPQAAQRPAAPLDEGPGVVRPRPGSTPTRAHRPRVVEPGLGQSPSVAVPRSRSLPASGL